MGVLGINRKPVNGMTPIAGIPAEFYTNADEILTQLEGYGCYIVRNPGNHWYIVVEGADTIRWEIIKIEPDPIPVKGDPVTSITLPSSLKPITVGLALVTPTGGAGVTFGNTYNIVSTAANRFWWLDVTSTGGADTATLEKGSAFPDPPATQNTATPVVHSYIPMWEYQQDGTGLTNIVNWYAWPRMDVRT